MRCSITASVIESQKRGLHIPCGQYTVYCIRRVGTMLLSIPVYAGCMLVGINIFQIGISNMAMSHVDDDDVDHDLRMTLFDQCLINPNIY